MDKDIIVNPEIAVYGVESDINVKTDVFISYKREDIEFVTNLCKELTAHNISVWLDVEKLSEDIGYEYKERIQNAIRNAQLVLFVYTEKANSSEFIIEEEIGYASSINKRICCYAHETVNFDSIDSRLSRYVKNIQWLAGEQNVQYILKVQEAIKDEKKRLALANSIRDMGVIDSAFQDINLFLIRIAVQKILGHPTPYGTFSLISRSDSVYSREEKGIGINVKNMSLFIDIPDDKMDVLKELKFCKRDEELKEGEREISNLLKTLSESGLDRSTLMAELEAFISENNYSYEDIHTWITEHKKGISLPEIDCFGFREFISAIADITADAFIEQIKGDRKTMFNGAMLGVLDIQDSRTCNLENHELYISMYHSDYFTFKCMDEIYHILRSIKNTFVGIEKNVRKFAPFLCSLGMGGFVVVEQGGHQVLMWAKRSGSISSGDMWHFSYDETVNLLKDSVREVVDGKEAGIRINSDNSIDIDPYKNLFRALKEENGLSENNINGNSGIVSVGIITSERLEIELLSFATVRLDSSSSIPMQMRKFQHSAPDGYLEISNLEFKDIYDSVNNYIGRLLTPEAHYLSEYLQMNKDILLCDIAGRPDLMIDKTVRVGRDVHIGKNCVIEDYTTLSDGCSIGDYCKIHRNVFVDEGVQIGNFVKIQNNNSIYHGVTLEDGVFVGTNVSFTNDRFPRSIKENGEPVTSGDWELEETIVRRGASIGAGAVIRCGIEIGEWAMVGCGAVVTKDVPPRTVVIGNPAWVYKTDTKL